MTAIAQDRAGVVEAADRLRDAARTGVPASPVRDLIGSEDIASAYAVQRLLVSERIADGATRVGRKIGLTSPAVQSQFGVSQPDFGVLFDDMSYVGGDTIQISTILQPRVEAEIAFALSADLAEGDLDLEQIRAAVDYAVAALEVCGSRIRNWDITFGDTVADNASAGAYVLGPRRRRLDEIEPRKAEMSMTIDGKVVSTGNGAACMGDPLIALQWLARQARDLGDPLKAGEIVLSGALGAMQPVDPGSTVSASISGIGKVKVTFSEE